jgi:hypothetical protein
MHAFLKFGLGPICALLAQAATAEAQIFISATGKDTNSCTRTAPCRTLQRGINATGVGRELTILTTGEYGRATVNKGMSILAEGVSANIRSFTSGSSAITVNAPGSKVVLKGLFLTGGNSGRYGIRVTAAAAIHIDDCTVERFAEDGIRFEAANAEYLLSDSVSRSNGSSGLEITTDVGTKLVIDNSRFENNTAAGANGKVALGSVTRSIASGNGGAGFSFGFNSPGNMNFTDTTAANNGSDGFVMNNNATLESVVGRGNANNGLNVPCCGTTVILSNSVFTNNNVGIHNDSDGDSPNPGILSRGNNTVAGNNTDTNGIGTKGTLAGQ